MDIGVYFWMMVDKRFQVSGVRCQVSAQPLAKTTAGLINKRN